MKTLGRRAMSNGARRLSLWLGLAIALSAAAAALGFSTVQQIARTLVVNLETPHPVEGVVVVPEPVPHSDTVSVLEAIVAPSSRNETNLWTEAGVVETEGFTSAVVSLHGQLRGNPTLPGAIVAVLVPDEENLLRALAEGEVHLSLEAAADPVPSGGLYFSGSRPGLPIGFPRYRLFLYNTTDRSASVNVFVYVTN
jgi:hypothetical protein